jgi:hypothetical protein
MNEEKARPLAYLAGPVTEAPYLAKARENMLYPSLNSAGLDVFKPHGAFSLYDDLERPSVRRVQQINDSVIRMASVVLVGVYKSGATARSRGTRHEIELAWHKEIPLVFVWMENVSTQHGGLGIGPYLEDVLSYTTIEAPLQMYNKGDLLLPGHLLCSGLMNYPEAAITAALTWTPTRD